MSMSPPPPPQQQPPPPPPPQGHKIRVKPAKEKWDRSKAYMMQAVVMVMHTMFHLTPFTPENSKYRKVGPAWERTAQEVMTQHNIKQLTGSTLAAAVKDLKTQGLAGDFSKIQGVDSATDEKHRKMLKELLKRIQRFERRQRAQEAASHKRKRQQATRGRWLRDAARSGQVPSSMIYKGFKHYIAAENAQQVGNSSAGAGAGAGAAAGHGAGAGAAAGVIGSGIDMEAAVALQKSYDEQQQKNAWHTDDDEDSDGSSDGTAATKRRRRRRRNGKSPAKQQSPPIMSPERQANLQLEQGLGTVMGGMPATERARISSEERIAKAKTEAETARHLATLRFQAESEKRAAAAEAARDARDAARRKEDEEREARGQKRMMELLKFAMGKKTE